MSIRLHILVSGVVTGVGFRYFVERNANKIGVGGWVKNVGDNVEAEFVGQEEHVEKMLKLCREGPAGAEVEKVQIVEKKTVQTLEKNFQIIL